MRGMAWSCGLSSDMDILVSPTCALHERKLTPRHDILESSADGSGVGRQATKVSITRWNYLSQLRKGAASIGRSICFFRRSANTGRAATGPGACSTNDRIRLALVGPIMIITRIGRAVAHFRG